MRLKHRVVALFGGRRRVARPAPLPPRPSPPVTAVTAVAPPTVPPPTVPPPPDVLPAEVHLAGGPGAATSDSVDPCGPSRLAVGDACSLADRMNALALDVALQPGSIDRLDEEFLVWVDGHDAVACVLSGVGSG